MEDKVTVELSQREVKLLLQYGYPFEDEQVQLEAFQHGSGPHRLAIHPYYLSMMIADLVRSAKTIRKAAILEELDSLCSTLEAAEPPMPRSRAVK